MHVSNAEVKVERLLGLIKEASEQLASQCEVEVRADGSRMIYGPFPSFLILVEEIGQPRALIHVNADAPNLVYIFKKLADEVAFDGPFAVDGATGNLIIGQDAYKKKEDNILMFAKDILGRRQEQKQEGILVPEKKIILS